MPCASFPWCTTANRGLAVVTNSSCFTFRPTRLDLGEKNTLLSYRSETESKGTTRHTGTSCLIGSAGASPNTPGPGTPPGVGVGVGVPGCTLNPGIQSILIAVWVPADKASLEPVGELAVLGNIPNGWGKNPNASAPCSVPWKV